MTKKDKNAAVRLPWEVWKALDLIRAERTATTKKVHTLSDILREAINQYIGEPWKNKTN